MSRKKKLPEPKCPHCGCPELLTYARQCRDGYVTITSCPGCGKVVQPASDQKAAEIHPLFEQMERLSSELCQTQAFVLRALERAGLTVVSEADKRVLEAMWAIPDGTLRRALEEDTWVNLPESIMLGLAAEKDRRKP